MDKKADNQAKDSTEASQSLFQIKSMFSKLAKALESTEATEADFEESKSVFNKVVDWCITNWYVLSTSVAEEKLVLDIYKEL